LHLSEQVLNFVQLMLAAYVDNTEAIQAIQTTLNQSHQVRVTFSEIGNTFQMLTSVFTQISQVALAFTVAYPQACLPLLYNEKNISTLRPWE
jgi:hypothetical protein